MKKIVTITMVMVLAVIALTGCTSKENYYRVANGKVLNSKQVITQDGNVWNYDTELKENTKIKVTFNTQNTKKVTDDSIEKITLK